MAKATTKTKCKNPYPKLSGDLYYGLLINGVPMREYNDEKYEIDLAQDLNDFNSYWDFDDLIKLLKKNKGKVTVELTKFKRVVEKA